MKRSYIFMLIFLGLVACSALAPNAKDSTIEFILRIGSTVFTTALLVFGGYHAQQSFYVQDIKSTLTITLTVILIAWVYGYITYCEYPPSNKIPGIHEYSVFYVLGFPFGVFLASQFKNQNSKKIAK